jgi:hypothetical protein
MRVAIYARVSTDDKGQDPENQLRELRAWCANAGYTVQGRQARTWWECTRLSFAHRRHRMTSELALPRKGRPRRPIWSDERDGGASASAR